MLAGVPLLAAVWVFLVRYVPDGAINTSGGFVPNRSDLLRAFAPAVSAVLVFLLALGLVGGWFLAGRMLAPLDRIGAAARLAANGSLSHRVDLDGPKDEFRDLADIFDAMLARLEAHIAEQQRFAANASHELRTPLAVSQTLLEVARNDPERDEDPVLDRLQSVNTRAIELTEALLLLSRADRRFGGTAAADGDEPRAERDRPQSPRRAAPSRCAHGRSREGSCSASRTRALRSHRTWCRP